MGCVSYTGPVSICTYIHTAGRQVQHDYLKLGIEGRRHCRQAVTRPPEITPAAAAAAARGESSWRAPAAAESRDGEQVQHLRVPRSIRKKITAAQGNRCRDLSHVCQYANIGKQVEVNNVTAAGITKEGKERFPQCIVSS